MAKRQIRFYSKDMGQVGVTRWFDEDEAWQPVLSGLAVDAVEIAEKMTLAQFKARIPLIGLAK